ncbi:long-chain fatty acid--CoA ligase [Paeniglutamicibacter psychrophenolicus]|uniref:Long-chain acyl-CoA synthetase n=1 Tax=Paeniglutamicibacter psychrophenolicus TaxID=257454 RepID=A0ABS4WCH8_9MICC|nr:long-chain acyl-CoA synthetase [Paeniglutamicibacter psychrophenolicus]
MNAAVPNATLSVAAILAEGAKRHGELPAITLGGASTSYRDLWDQTRAYAGALREAGVMDGDRVAILIPNVTDFARVYYAVLSLGAVAVPIHALLKRHEIEYVLTDAEAKLMVCAAPLLVEGAAGAVAAGANVLTVLSPEAGEFARLEDLAGAAAPIDTYLPRGPLDIATILYTSGTTGKPKGALGTHFALVEQVNVLLLNTFDMRRGDKIFGGLPLFHTFGQTVALNTGLRAGAEILLLPKFTGEAALSMLLDQGVNIFIGVPTMYVGLLAAAKARPEPAPSLRYAVSGGAALPLAILDGFREHFGATIHEGYGLTETSPVASFNHVGTEPRPGTVGQAIWGVEIEVARPEVHDAIELLGAGELGELVVRGHNLFSGYLNRPEATAEAMVDGWFRTGDLGTKDSEGYITIVDRKKDMILRNGYNVYPREVEEVLIAHPEITNVAVFGVPDETHGQEIVAAVTLVAGSLLDANAIVDYAQERLAAYKYPRLVEIVVEFPLGPSGKILKRELVSRYTED